MIESNGLFMKKVLIFGAGGFVGKYLSEEMINHGYVVEGSDMQKTDNILDAVGFFPCNILDTEKVAALIQERQPDYIVNLAAISSVGASWNMPAMTMSVNVVGALNILEAAKKLQKMPEIMFIGSSEEYVPSSSATSEDTELNANNPYGISKMTQEKFAEMYRQRYGMRIYYVRPFNHTGIGQRDSFVLPSFCRQAAEIESSGKPGTIHVGNLEAKRDFSDVRDIVRAYRLILESGNYGTVYNVGSGEAYSLKDILNHIIAFSNQKIDVVVDEDKYRPIDTPLVLCDYHKIKSELGWEPQYSIFDTLKEMYQYYLQQSKKNK